MTDHLSLLKTSTFRAEAILEGVEALPEEPVSFEPESAEIICKYGISLTFYEQAKLWLENQEGRRLFWIEDCPERLARLKNGSLALEILTDRRVQIFYVETLLDRELAIQKIIWLSTYKELKVLDPEWNERFSGKLMAAKLIASDAAELALPIWRHVRANFRRPMKRLSALKGSMQGVPAIIIGAGPSLEKNGHLLEAYRDKALLITAGSAIHSVKTRPSLAVLLDPHQSIGKTPYPNLPFCIQGRTHPKSQLCTSGEVLYFPDAHFPFEPWLTESALLDTGWTVGNGAVRVAIELGCNPIILVGMDYCYRGRQKYAWKKGSGDMALVLAKDASGREVWTQSDWLMAVRWMEETASSHPEITLINATVEGIQMGAPVHTANIPSLPSLPGLEARWRQAIQGAPFVELTEDRLRFWHTSLAACRWNFAPDEVYSLAASNQALELLLEPLWKIWGPFFERELMTDSHPMPLEDKLQLQKRLFFNRVIEEHIENPSSEI